MRTRSSITLQTLPERLVHAIAVGRFEPPQYFSLTVLAVNKELSSLLRPKPHGVVAGALMSHHGHARIAALWRHVV